MIVLLVVLNLVISVFNAWSVGRSWYETKAVGGFVRFMAWMGATMSAVGFTWSYLVVIAALAGPDGFQRLPPHYVDAMFSLGYLVLIGPCIGSGIAITIDSWAHFWRKRTFGSGAVAGWNTFADIYNIYNAARYVPTAWDNVMDLFSSKKGSSSSSDDDDSSPFAAIAIALALLAVLGGVLTTAAIIRTVAQATARDRQLKYAAND
jgi:hypothetical protein